MNIAVSQRKTTTLFLALFALLAAAYVMTGAPVYWGKALLKYGLIWLTAGSLLALGLRRLRPSLAPVALCGAFLIFMVFGLGLRPSLSVAFFFAAAHAIGFLVFKMLYRSRTATATWISSLSVGLLSVLALWSILIRYRINERWFYLVLLAAPLVLALFRYPAEFGNGYIDAFNRFISWTRNISFPLLAMFIIVAGWVASYSLFPTVGSDDLVYHVRMWSELRYEHKASFDFTNQIFLVSPFVVDLFHAIVSMLAGDDARGAWNFGLMLLLIGQAAALLRRLVQSLVTEEDQSLVVLLMISTPMLTYLLITLQNELFLAFLCTTGVRLILDSDEGWLGHTVVALMAIIGMAVATKLTGLVLGVFLLAALFVKIQFFNGPATPSASRPNSIVLMMLTGGVFVAALYPYAIAYSKTGNPVFPFYNGIFKSPFFPQENFIDGRWTKGFTLRSYWNVFFQTSDYYESQNFVAGFQYLVLFLPALLFAWRRGVPRAFSILLIPLLGFGLVIFSSTQYWRYLFPVMPLASVFCAVLLIPKDGLSAYAVRGLILGCICLNMFFSPGTSWRFPETPPQSFFSGGRDTLLKKMVLGTEAVRYLNDKAPGARVLFAVQPEGALLNGTPLYVEWYAPDRVSRFGGITRTEDVDQFLKDEKVQFVVWSLTDATETKLPRALLRQYLSRRGYPIFQKNSTVVYSLSRVDPNFKEAFNYPKLAENPEALNALPVKLIDGQMQVTNELKTLSTVEVNDAVAVRYHVSFTCPAASGSFIARVDWNVGEIYYRLVPCEAGRTDFSELIRIPVGATKGTLNVETREIESIQISTLTLEVL